MTMKDPVARLTALVLACAVVASCESRTATEPGTGGTGTTGVTDNTFPTVKVTGSAKDTVYLGGAPFSVTVVATDNIGVSTLSTTVRNGAAVVSIQQDTLKPPVTTTTKTLGVPLSGYNKGDKLVVRSTASDAALNSATDSVVVTVADTTAPTLAVTSTQSGRTVKGLDSIDVAVLAADSAGVAYAGYRLLLVRPTDSLLIRRDSLFPAVRSTVFNPAFGFIISDTLPIGTYVLQGFAKDKSGLSTRAPLPVVTFTLSDAQAPTASFTQPKPAGKVAVGDSILVTTVLHDNAGIARVVLSGFSARGNPALGTQDTVTRYTSVTAPSTGTFRAGLKDTTISRWLRAVAPVDTMQDSVRIRAVVSDASNNTGSAVTAVRMVPTLSITSLKAGQSLKPRDTVDVRVTAGDTSGVTYLGYRLLRVRISDSVVVSSDSIGGGSAPSVTNIFKLALLDTLSPGSYTLRAFSKVLSAIGTRTAQGPGFTVSDTIRPTITFTTPVEPSTLGVGDSLRVIARLRDNIGVVRVTFQGFSVRGNQALGTSDTVVRYTSVTVPGPNGSFTPPPRDTIIERYLKVITPIDSAADTLRVVGTVTDVAGLTASATQRVQMTNGPKVQVTSPVAGDSLTPGSPFTVTVKATSTAGVARVGFSLQSDPSWPTPVTASFDSVLTAASPSVTYSATVTIPANAPPKGTLTITPRAVDINGQSGATTPTTIAVRAGAPPAPRVVQQVPARVEITDPIFVSASGDRLTWVGFELRDRSNAVVKRDSVHVSPAGVSTVSSLALPLNLTTFYQGKKLAVTSFARDSAGRIGFSVPANTLTPQTNPALAFVDSTLVVYGQTFLMPATRAGIAGDLTVDSLRGNVFVSNTSYNRLERWSASSGTFDASGVAVGSLPWGMAVQNDNDTLLVANSGGTNISKVCINVTTCGSISEILSQRILTRNTVVFTVQSTRDPATGKIALSASAPISFSDRPQYVQQSAGGRLFYSTRPTAFAPAGTIRWLDPKLPVPDPRQIYQYAEKTVDNTYAIFNADSVLVIKFPNDPAKSDELILFDHVYGQKTGGSCTAPQTNGGLATVANTICGRDSAVTSAITKVNVQGGDVEGRLDIDVALLGLTDTTFVASSGDRTWIGFGEGNTKGAVGRVILANDVAGDPVPRFFSPGVTVRDLSENASESVFGMGLDRFGSTVAVHGKESYFAAVENPFHLRLQGKYDNFDAGAGITFHPKADLRSGFVSSSKTDSTRTAFIASANGGIEVVDAAFYINRGTLQIKGNLYGPLRASMPFTTDNVGIPATDPRFIVLKLFGLTGTGLVVINLRASDILPVP